MAFIKFKPLAPTINFRTILKKEDVVEKIKDFISNDETVSMVFKTHRDICVFTNYRIFLIDRKGIRGFRKSYMTVFYKSISSLDMSVGNIDSKITLILDSGHIFKLNFMKPIPLETMYEVYKYVFDRIKVK